MIAVEHLRRVEIGADILDHDIGRVAIAAHRDIAIGKGESLQPALERRLHDLDIGAHHRAQRIGVQALEPGQPVAQMPGHALLARRRAVRQPRFQRRPRALVDAETGGEFGRVAQELLGDRIQRTGGRRILTRDGGTHHRLDFLGRADAWRIEAIRTRRRVGFETRDRVVQIGNADEKILRAADQQCVAAAFVDRTTRCFQSRHRLFDRK